MTLHVMLRIESKYKSKYLIKDKKEIKYKTNNIFV